MLQVESTTYRQFDVRAVLPGGGVNVHGTVSFDGSSKTTPGNETKVTDEAPCSSSMMHMPEGMPELDELGGGGDLVEELRGGGERRVLLAGGGEDGGGPLRLLADGDFLTVGG